MEATRTCIVDGCERRQGPGRGLCHMHYHRWNATGDVGGAETVRPSQRGLVCNIEACDRPAKTRQLCEMHYGRWRRTRRPAERLGGQPPVLVGAANPIWKGDGASYHSLHQRIRRERGPARSHPCANCGRRALHWAYDHCDPAEVRSPKGYVYSFDISRYRPLCGSCHQRLDRAHRAQSLGGAGHR